jgi:hypothetical protein
MTQGSYKRVDATWDPGFRVAAGWNTSYDFWDLALVWTWYRNHSTKSVTASHPGVGTGLYPLFPVSIFISGGPTNFANGHGSYRLLHNAIDLELGRYVFSTQTLSFRPHFGVRGAWLNQKFNTLLSNGIPAGLAGAYIEGHGKNNYWGVGPRLGTHMGWHLPRGFNVIGQVSGSLLYGQTKASFYDIFFVPTEDVVPNIDLTFNNNFDQLVPNLQLLLGLEWGSSFRCEKMFFSCSVAWETNYWWNQFNIPVLFNRNLTIGPFPTVGNQPVTLEGITVDMRIDF